MNLIELKENPNPNKNNNNNNNNNNVKEPIIRCIFFCEFHHTAGRIISCQVPENYISKELFDSISVYVITKAELQRSTITVTLEDNKVLGFPIRIVNKKYARNAFHFNLCFVCDSETRTVQYEHVVRKFSDYLKAMEIENAFLSTGNPKEKLTPILKKVLNELNTKGECALIDGPITTHLKVSDLIRQDPPKLFLDHQVPVFLKEFPDDDDDDHQPSWDLTTQQVTPYIDGFNHIARIAILSNVDNNLVKSCIRNLVYYGVVALVPLFQYGNVYCSTPKLKSLAHDHELQKRCLNYVARNNLQIPNLRDVFRIYSAMGGGTTIRELFQRFNFPSLRINERKLVQFGVLEQLIRRINKYPILIDGEIISSSDLEHSSFTGNYCIDEICCATGMNSQQLEDRLDRDHNIIVLSK